jgi:hypothetical protein
MFNIKTNTMKNNLFSAIGGALLLTVLIFPLQVYSQSEKGIVKKYMQELPSGKPSYKEGAQKYRMTAVYTNRDLYGNFTGKTKVTGDYTCGLENGMATWNNVSIASSDDFSESFPEGKRQEYMENFKYVPSSEMLKEDAFKSFPSNAENVLSRNLIWDMGTIEGFARDYSDSLKMNVEYMIPQVSGEFAMAGIGTYNHVSIQVCWTGISYMYNELCAVIEYRALDNKIEMSLDQIQTRGTEQYWGTTWVSLGTRQIEYAEMYGGTIQEIIVRGLKEKMYVKTIRELEVERIKQENLTLHL